MNAWPKIFEKWPKKGLAGEGNPTRPKDQTINTFYKMDHTSIFNVANYLKLAGTYGENKRLWIIRTSLFALKDLTDEDLAATKKKKI